MRILMIIDTLRRGGKERRVVELLKGLIDSDIKASLIILSDIIEFEEVFQLPVEIHTIKRKVKYDLSVFPRISTVVNEYKPDIIQVWELMAAFYMSPIAKLHGVKLISSVIADSPSSMSFFGKQHVLSKFSFYLADKIIGNSKAGINAYKAPLHKSLCIYNGIDLKRFSHVSSREAFLNDKGIPVNQTIIGMVASFTHFKDYRTFVEAAILLNREFNNLVFVCIGDGPNIGEMKELASKNNLPMIFTGKISNVEEWVQCFDIGVLSTYTEGISNAIIEYMIMGKPVVATDGGGTNELVVDGSTGYLVKPQSPEDLSNKIKRILFNPENGLRMGEEGNKRILQLFNLNEMTRRYVEIYSELTS